MAQIESPKRKLQKQNDYQRHKLFRKIKRRRKAQAEAQQEVAEKQLKKKLKMPKYDEGKTREVYTKDLSFDDTGGGVDRYGNKFDYVALPDVEIKAQKLPTFEDIEKQIGRKITQDEMDKILAVDPRIKLQLPNTPTEKGMYAPSFTNYLTNLVYGEAGEVANKLADATGAARVAPDGELIETRDGDALFDLPGYGQVAKIGLYGLSRYGGKFGLNRLQDAARRAILNKEFTLSNIDADLAGSVANNVNSGKEISIPLSKKQSRLQLNKPTYQVYNGKRHSISEIIDDKGNVNLTNLFKIQDEALNNIPGGRIARHRLENSDWHKTDWNTFMHSRDAYQRALQAGYPKEALFPTLMHDVGKLWAGEGHGPYGASIIQQMFPDATKEQIVAIYQHMDKVPESAMGKLVKGADIAEDNQFRNNVKNLTFQIRGEKAIGRKFQPSESNFLKERGYGNSSIVGKNLSDKIKEGYFNYTNGQEIPLNFDGNYFRVTKNMPQVIAEDASNFKNYPIGEFYSENIDDYYKSVMQPLFDQQNIDPSMRLPRGIITSPENNVAWKGYFDDYSGVPYIKAKAVNGNIIDAIKSGQFNSTYLHEAASHATDFKIPKSLQSQYNFEKFLPSDYTWKPNINNSKSWREYRATMNQVRHRLLDTELLINGKYPSPKELKKAIDDRQMDIIMANFDVANGYGADYYNAYKDLLNKAKSTNNSRDWQNAINLENHIRNSLKYLPVITPFVIGAKSYNYNYGKDIHIKPSKRGTFTKAAKARGMSVQEFANKVLKDPSKYSSTMRKKANFAHNAASWKH